MEELIRREIKYLARKKLKAQEAHRDVEAHYRSKYQNRTALPGGLPNNNNPSYVHRHFDPVFCLRKATYLSKVIWFKCQNDSYEPIPALVRHTPKPGGGTRPIMEFSIPDSAVSRVVHSKIAPRNLKNQSANSYAYRKDRNIFDALLKLKNSIDKPKVFIAQYDFEKFFDSIPQSYLNKLLHDRELFVTTKLERNIIKKYMQHKYATHDQYALGDYETRSSGTPQGSSISLLLANLANAPLDKELERLNGQFVRFADDVVNVAYNYEDALRIESAFHNHCRESGIKLNVKKSPGVFVLSPSSQELRSKKSFVFLGYEIAKSGFTISEKAINKLKKKISRLINLYLHRHPRQNEFNINRAGIGYDYDLIGCLYEIRSMIYGGVTENNINRFLYEGVKLPKMKGYMGFYCLIDDYKPLLELDGWIASTLFQAVRKRAFYLNSLGHLYTPPNYEQIISGNWFTNPHNHDLDTKLPSLVRGWRAARKYYYTYGLEDVEAPTYLAYY